MSLSHIFQKPIGRPIEGVIKADDKAGLRQEFEEYVLTNEVAKRLENFLYAYNNYEGANGVWISGFFGSGKSHLLKILAFILENREIEGALALELFLPKCGDNEILKADLRRAVAVPSRSILFNIDQKADVIAKTQIDALLSVFVKVFDEMCGYYGKQGHIAQFERDLDSRDQFASFKQAYQQTSGQTWEFGREQSLLEAHNIAAAYAAVTGTPAEDAVGILDKYRAEYKVSIEDFAEQVNAYIDQRGPEFRLNFFVDEVGQYIADHVKLMTNLQTIAESLATKCRGRAWILVTAQEEMTDIVGDMEKQPGTDFSKIQDRFSNRMKLTSADVAEVIQKRLLQKNEAGIQQLTAVYQRQHNNFKTLFDFADGAQTYRNFRNRDHFIHTYPFIPYQFPLFQAAIRSLSLHNAFEGKHRSVGERSMLGVFQQVAIQIGDHKIGQLATFDLMFEGIRTALKTEIQQSILTAEEHLRHPFAVQVLKALFLIKYVEEFKATPRNLSVLMLDSFDADLPALRDRLQEALDLLVQQTYIQRHGEAYEYLTNEEKDVEQEIKNTDVEASAVADELGKIVFDYVIKERKIRYQENAQFYSYTRKLDGRSLGREHELAIHIISPFYEHAENDEILHAHSMGRDELFVVLPASKRLMNDLLMVLQTEKYIRQNISVTQKESIKQILTAKQLKNQERRQNMRRLVEELLAQAQLIVSGSDLEISSSDPQTRIIKGFHDLLTRTYPNLRMLQGETYTEAKIGSFLHAETTLLGGDAATFTEAEHEMLNYIDGNKRSGQRTTMQKLVNHFEHKPNGWYLAAIQCILAKLIARGKVEPRLDGNILAEEELERALRNTHGHTNLTLEPQIVFTASQRRQLRDFYADFFDGPPAANEAKSLGLATAAAFRELSQELNQLRHQSTRYPFLAVLAEPVETLREIGKKPYTFFLTELRNHEDKLFDMKEQVLDPVRRFMSGSSKQIYDEAQQFLATQEPNLAYLNGDEVANMRAILEDPHCYRGGRMQQVKTHLDTLREQITALVKKEKATTLAKVDERWQRLAGMAEYEDLTEAQQQRLQEPFNELKQTIQRQALIAVIRDTLHRFDETEYPNLLRKMTVWAQPTPEPNGDEEFPDGQTGVVEPSIDYEIINFSALDVSFNKALLSEESDVKAYVAALKQALLTAVANGKRIQI